MSYLADVNVVVDDLRSSGVDVTWALEFGPMFEDWALLDAVDLENRVLLTFDLDFGDLVFRDNYSLKTGIVLFRLSNFRPEQIAARAGEVLMGAHDLKGFLTVVTEDEVRQRRLPRFSPSGQ